MRRLRVCWTPAAVGSARDLRPVHGHMADRVRAGADGAHNRLLSRTVTASGCSVRIESGLDPLADQIVLAVGAMQVDVMQDTGAGPRQRGGDQFRAERGLACGMPGAAVDGLAGRYDCGRRPKTLAGDSRSRCPVSRTFVLAGRDIRPFAGPRARAKA